MSGDHSNASAPALTVTGSATAVDRPVATVADRPRTTGSDLSTVAAATAPDLATATNISAPTAAAAPFRDHVFALFTELNNLDREIHALEVETAPLAPMITELVQLNHPSLWLVMGREGIDRPGTIGALVGQQVVTRYQRNRRVEIAIAAVALVIGVLIGLAALFALQMAGIVVVS